MQMHVTLYSLPVQVERVHNLYVIFNESYQHSDVLFTMRGEYW